MSRPGDDVEYIIPSAPSLSGSVRATLVDFFYNSWRLVPANLIWGVGFVALLFVGLSWLPAAVLALILLALPAAGVFRMATLIARQQPVAFSDSLAAWRQFLRPALISGTVLTVITLVLGTNIVIGFSSREPLGWAVATAAGWGLLATWAVALPYWPLLLDPMRGEMPMLDILRLAGALVLNSPLRFGLLLVIVAALAVASLILFAALLTISIALMALLVSHYTLPAADRLEQRPTQRVFS